MRADYYVADTQSGNHVDDPSEDALYMLLDDLNDTDNTILDITPANPASSWSASVTRRVDGGFEIVRRDPSRGEHDETVEPHIDRIARDLTIWLAGRGFGVS